MLQKDEVYGHYCFEIITIVIMLPKNQNILIHKEYYLLLLSFSSCKKEKETVKSISMMLLMQIS